jgi:nitrite reductase (NADH) large subunit
VKTAEEVKEYSGAFLQLYREEAYYLDRTVHYIARVGLEYIKAKVVADAANRQALYQRCCFPCKACPTHGRRALPGRRKTNSSRSSWKPEERTP